MINVYYAFKNDHPSIKGIKFQVHFIYQNPHLCVNPETNNILYLRRRESIGKRREVADEAKKRSKLAYSPRKEDRTNIKRTVQDTRSQLGSCSSTAGGTPRHSTTAQQAQPEWKQAP